MFDVRPSDTNVIDMAIRLDCPIGSIAPADVIQGLSGPAPLGSTNIITFAFGLCSMDRYRPAPDPRNERLRREATRRWTAAVNAEGKQV